MSPCPTAAVSYCGRVFGQEYESLLDMAANGRRSQANRWAGVAILRSNYLINPLI